MELVSLPSELATPARPFLTSEHTLHQQMGVDTIRFELGYRDVTTTVDALGETARFLRDNPIERGSITEQRLQDPFDYQAEDVLIEASREAVGEVRPLSDAYDPDFRNRYAPGSSDWRLVEPKNKERGGVPAWKSAPRRTIHGNLTRLGPPGRLARPWSA